MRRLALLALLVAACGDEDPARHLDGGTSDSTADIDAQGPPAVTITVMRGGVPNAGVTVYFQNADSGLVATKQTDSTGTASQVMNAGGFVTAVDPFEVAAGLPTKEIRTFAGVKPGDHLKLEEPSLESVQVNVLGPVESSAALEYYMITTPCSPPVKVTRQVSASATGTTSLYNCPSSTDYQLVAFDANDRVISSVYAPNKTVSASGTVDLSALAFTAASDRAYTFTNVPNTIGGFRVTDQLLSAKGALGSTTDFVTATTTTTFTMKAPGFTNASSLVYSDASSSRSRHYLLDWGPFGTTYTTDVGARLLKDFTSNLTYSATTHAVTWTETATGVAPDFVELTAFGTRGNEGFNIDWELIAPYSAGTVTLPTLPPGMYDLNFSGTDQVDWRLEMSKFPGGYDAVRAGFFVMTGPVGATGSATIVKWEPEV